MTIDPNTNNYSNSTPQSSDSTSSTSGETLTPATPKKISSPLSKDTLQTGQGNVSNKNTNIEAQTPQLSEIAYQKFIGDVSREFKDLLNQLEQFDAIHSQEFSMLFAAMAILALKNYQDKKSKIFIPPAPGTSGGNSPPGSPGAPGGSSGGSGGIFNPYAAIDKEFAKQIDQIKESRTALAYYSEYLDKYGLGALAFKPLNQTIDPTEAQQQEYALNQQKADVKSSSSLADPTQPKTAASAPSQADDATSPENSSGVPVEQTNLISTNLEDNSNFKNLFNPEALKALESLLGPENAQRAFDLSHIITVQLLSLTGLTAGKEAIQLIAKNNNPETTRFDSPQAHVASSVGLVQNLAKHLSPQGSDNIQNIIETSLSQDSVLKNLPQEQKDAIVKIVGEEIATSILKIALVEVETGLGIGKDLSQLLNTSSKTADTPTTASNTSSTIPSDSTDSENSFLSFSDWDDFDFLKPYIPKELSHGERLHPILLLKKVVPDSSSETSPKEFAEELVKHILIAGVPGSIAYTKASQITIAIIAARQKEDIQQLILDNIDKAADRIALALQNDESLINNPKLTEDLTQIFNANGTDEASATSATNALLSSLNTNDTPPLSQQTSDNELYTSSTNLQNQLTDLLQKNIDPALVPQVVSQLLNTIVGYPQTDAILSNTSPNPHSLLNIARDKLTTDKNDDYVQEKQTIQDTKHTENFRDFINEHSDLTTFAEELRSPAKALVMSWGLMNEGTFKFSGKTNSIDFMG